MDLPYEEESENKNVFIRTFKEDVDSHDLMWHRDRENRIIESLEKTNWMIQLDNELPKKINAKIEIPSGFYHRLIKGDNDLKLKIIKTE